MAKVIDRGNRSKALNEVKPVERISKNLQRILEVLRKRKSFFHINCKTVNMSTRILLD